jgi:hypothetical protein
VLKFNRKLWRLNVNTRRYISINSCRFESRLVKYPNLIAVLTIRPTNLSVFVTKFPDTTTRPQYQNSHLTCSIIKETNRTDRHCTPLPTPSPPTKDVTADMERQKLLNYRKKAEITQLPKKERACNDRKYHQNNQTIVMINQIASILVQCQR